MQSLFNGTQLSGMNGPNNFATTQFLEKQRAVNRLKAQLSHLINNKDFRNFQQDSIALVPEKCHKVQQSAYENFSKAKNI